MSNRIWSARLNTNRIFTRIQPPRLFCERSWKSRRYPLSPVSLSSRRISLIERAVVTCSSVSDPSEYVDETALTTSRTNEGSGFGQSLGKTFSNGLRVFSAPLPQTWKDHVHRWTSDEEGMLNRYYEKVDQINALESKMVKLTDDELQQKTSEFRSRISNGGETMDDILIEAFAVVREVSHRLLNMRHFDCQLVGGMVLHEGCIAEMETGEGKTLVATLPVYLNVCGGHSVHIITVNEYLADRDAKWMGAIYNFLGLSVTAVKEKMSIPEKQDAYKCDVVYVTAQKLCFDYLNDWTASDLTSLVLQDLDFAIVDEVDSILIDESRNPMIISESSGEINSKIRASAEVISNLMEENRHGLVNQLANQMTEIDLLRLRGISDQIPVTDVLLIRNSIDLLSRIMTNTEFLPQELVSDELQKELLYYNRMETLKNREIFETFVVLLLQLKRWFDQNMVYKAEARLRKVTITPYGAELLKSALEARGEIFEGNGGVSLWESSHESDSWGPYLINAIKAVEFYRLGKEYIIVRGNIVIIDESTGRTKEQSRWPDSLHQAVEAKEQILQQVKYGNELPETEEEIEILPESSTTASITFQVFFRYYKKLAGMSGTAVSEELEFWETYNLPVAHIPTHFPCKRIDNKPIVFFENRHKVQYIILQLANSHGVRYFDYSNHHINFQSRPVLIGTNSVEESEALMEQLKYDWYGPDKEIIWNGDNQFKQRKLLMLNARPEVIKDESRIIAQAGLPGMVTIATKMAGRGTDILLGGNPKGLVENVLYTSIFRRCIPDLETEGQISLPEFDLSFDGSKKAPPSISGLIMTALARAQGTEEAIMTVDDVDVLMARVMSFAQGLHSEVIIKLKGDHMTSSLRLMELDFEKNIRLTIAQVWTEHEAEVEKETPFVQALIHCAVYAWLWFDQKCEAYADTVRSAGGLLVIGTSIAESKRIENQLRGRAGRQGDPGESIMLCDISDQMLRMWQFENARKIFERASTMSLDRIEGRMAELIVDQTRSGIEEASRSAREQLASYDEIMEEFRQHFHFLKRILIQGTNEERTQLLYCWIQDVADGFVNACADPSIHPKNWIIWLDSKDERHSLEEAIDRLFNPVGLTSLHPFLNIRLQKFPSPEELYEAYSISQNALEELVKDTCRLSFVRVIPFTPKMKKELIEALNNRSIPFTPPAMHFAIGRRPLTLEIRHALALHKTLTKQRRSNEQTKIKGRYCEQVEMLQEYIGELMIMLFEERKLQLVEDLCREDNHLQSESIKILHSSQKHTMLNLLNIFWADFLMFADKLKTATNLSSLRGPPLEEFSVEAHKEFASMMTVYRQVVVMKIITPSLHIAPNNNLIVWMDLMESYGDVVDNDASEEEDRSPDETSDSSEASQSSNRQH
eukprot:g1870.t1